MTMGAGGWAQAGTTDHRGALANETAVVGICFVLAAVDTVTDLPSTLRADVAGSPFDLDRPKT